MRLLAAAALACLAAASPAAAQSLPAQIVDIERPSQVRSFEVTDYVTGASGMTQWRVVPKTGNCCEQYLQATEKGRILDFGGSYINYTDDRGLTWKSVRPQGTLVNGEGAIVLAPAGDILGVEWDPYSGDHLLAFKYTAAEDAWTYMETPLKTPFYDREWLAAVPGPFGALSDSVSHLGFMRGGTATKEPWLYSQDGLTYFEASSTTVDHTSEDPVEGPLSILADRDFDWIQPNTNTGLTPLGKGSALAIPGEDGDWSVLNGDTLKWSAFTFPGGKKPEGRYQVDSQGRLHNVDMGASGFMYRISVDGGRSWTETEVSLPAGQGSEEWDYRANAAVGIAAVSVHAEGSNADTDHVYKLDIRGDRAVLARHYRLGNGDVNATAGLGNTTRFDFANTAILPDGRVATSVLDSKTPADSLSRGEVIGPAIAIEGDSNLPAPAAAPTLTLTAAAPSVAYRRSAVLTGSLTLNGAPVAGAAISVASLDAGKAAFADLPALTTDSAGRFSLKVKPRVTTTYRFTAPGAVEQRAQVAVRYAVSASARRGVVSGRVAPARRGVRVVVQRGRKVLGRAKTDRRGRFRIKVRKRGRAVVVANGAGAIVTGTRSIRIR